MRSIAALRPVELRNKFAVFFFLINFSVFQDEFWKMYRGNILPVGENKYK